MSKTKLVDGVLVTLSAGEETEFFNRQNPFHDVASALAAKMAECERLAKAKRDGVVAGFSAGEMASWPIKRAEALAYLASSQPASAPMLGVEAAERGISLADLIDKVLTKSAALAGLEALIAGVNGRHQDALAALAADPAALASDVLAYDITTGWPAP